SFGIVATSNTISAANRPHTSIEVVLTGSSCIKSSHSSRNISPCMANYERINLVTNQSVQTGGSRLSARILIISQTKSHRSQHPRGVAEPSDTDVRLTRKLTVALVLIDGSVLFHFISMQGEKMSRVEWGLLRAQVRCNAFILCYNRTLQTKLKL
ncbi:MAG: hypothetical protein ACJAY2_003333, partial [Pseudomonadales bacterium]